MPRKRVREHQQVFNADYFEMKDAAGMSPASSGGQENYLRAVDRVLTGELKLRIGTQDQSRLYCYDEQNRLVSLADRDLISREGRPWFVNQLRSGRIFAVPAGEAAPVQLCPAQGKVGFSCADNLEVPPKPLNGWQKFWNRFGFYKREKADYDRDRAAYDAHAELSAELDRVKGERKAQGFAEEVLTGEPKANSPAAQELAAHQQTVEEGGRRLDEIKANIARAEECESIEGAAQAHEQGISTVRSIYGAQPVLRAEFLKKSDKKIDAGFVYTNEEFGLLEPYDGLGLTANGAPVLPVDEAGRVQLTEDDFTAVAMGAASLNEISGGVRADRAESARLDPALRGDSLSTMFTADLAITHENGAPNPRARLGGFFGSAIQPARNKAAEAIRAYQGNPPDRSKLAQVAASGMMFYGRMYSRMSQQSSGQQAMTHFYGRLGQMIENDPALREQVQVEVGKIKTQYENELKGFREDYKAFREEHGEELDGIRATHIAYSDALNKASSQGRAIEVLEAEKPRDEARIEQAKREHEETVARRDELSEQFAEQRKTCPEYFELIQQEARHMGRILYGETRTAFDLEQTLKDVKANAGVARTLDEGRTARARLARADLEGREMPPEEKQQCLRQILRSEMLSISEESQALKNEEMTSRFGREEPRMAALTRGIPIETAEEAAAQTERNTLSTSVGMQYENLHSTQSALHQAFGAPQEAQQTLDQMVDEMVSPEQQAQLLAQRPGELLKNLPSKARLVQNYQERQRAQSVPERVNAPVQERTVQKQSGIDLH